jgi:osmoprotectant transport system substrate-binding protein
MQSRSGNLARVGLLTLAAVAGAYGCGSSGGPASTSVSSTTATTVAKAPGTGKPAVTLGTKNFTEQLVLGQLYAQALRAKGFKVTLKSNIGASEVVDRKLASREIDGYPEYTGTILSVLAHQAALPASAAEAYSRAATFERGRGRALLAMSPATDTNVVVARPEYARQHRLRSLGDLAALGSSATLAGPPEFKTRFSGMVGLREAYGVTRLRFLPSKIGTQYRALADGRAQLATAFTTDGNLSQGGFALLADPKNIFGFQNVTFVVRDGVLDREGPDFAKAINSVSSKLSTQALRVMNAAVDLDQQTPGAVARQFLGANGLS